MRRTKEQGPTRICVCGAPKEDVAKRYCFACGEVHGQKMHKSHVGKGRGPRRKYRKIVLAPS